MHPIKRALLVFILGIGTVGGFAHGFHSLGRCASWHRDRHRIEFEEHVADVCLRAADRRAAAVGNAVPAGYVGWAPGYGAPTAPPRSAPGASMPIGPSGGCGSGAAPEGPPAGALTPAPAAVLVAPPSAE